MAEFGIAIDKTKRHTDEFEQYADLLAEYTEQIRNIGNSINMLGGSTERIRSVLRTASEHVENETQSARNMGIRLGEIIVLYEKTESGICVQAGGSIELRVLGSKNPANAEVDAQQDEGVWDYILDALKQAVFGDFTDESNLLGTALSVAIGFIPYVGQIADIRDLVADIYNLIDDGPTTEEWVALGFTVIGIIPGVGDLLKHGDEAGDLVKGLLKNGNHADEAADIVKNIFRKGDDIFSAVADKIDDFNDLFKHNVWDKVDDLIDNNSAGRAIKDTINNITDAVKNSDIYQDVDRILDRLDFSSGNFEISAKQFIEGMIGEYKENFEQDTITTLLNWITGNSQAEPAT